MEQKKIFAVFVICMIAVAAMQFEKAEAQTMEEAKREAEACMNGCKGQCAGNQDMFCEMKCNAKCAAGKLKA